MKHLTVLFPTVVAANLKRYNYLLMILSVVTILSVGCSKDEDKGENEGSGNESEKKYAPESAIGKTLIIDGQMFYVTFVSENACKVIPRYEWQTITSSSYVYKAISDAKATLTLSYKDKIVMGTSHTLSDTTYDLTLTFEGKGKGIIKGGWKSFITVNNGLGSVNQHYASESLDGKAFTLN